MRNEAVQGGFAGSPVVTSGQQGCKSPLGCGHCDGRQAGPRTEEGAELRQSGPPLAHTDIFLFWREGAAMSDAEEVEEYEG